MLRYCTVVCSALIVAVVRCYVIVAGVWRSYAAVVCGAVIVAVPCGALIVAVVGGLLLIVAVTCGALL